MRRAPWWAGGRFREVRRRLPRDYDQLPFWARLGFMTPFEATTVLWFVSIGCAVIGAGAALLMLIFSQPPL